MFDGSHAGISKTNTASGSKLNTMSSSELLDKMRNRNWVSTDDSRSQGPSGFVAPENLELLTDIRNHVAFGCNIDGEASTEEILSHFKPIVPVKLAPKFKAMLKQVCDLDKSSGIGIWRLKLEFR